MKEQILHTLSVVSEEENLILEGANSIDRNLYMNSTANIINAKKLIENGKYIEMRPHTRFIHFPEHTHDYVELVYMCSGQTTHIINGEQIVLHTGDVLILNQHAKQEILPADTPDIAVNFIILPPFFTKALELIGNESNQLCRFIMDCILGKESSNGYLLFKVSNIVKIQNLFENLICTFIEKTSIRKQISELTLSLILLELINHSNLLISTNIERNVLLDILNYIEENYPSCTLSDIAEKFHYNSNGISRMIKEKTGLTFIEILQNRRLSQAEWLLKNSQLRIDAIAKSIGYNNTNYFHKLFKKTFGISPKSYRDKCNKKQ